MSRLPPLTHLQFAVLSFLFPGECSGSCLRDELDRLRVSQTGPAFYQMMARMEDAGFVAGCYRQRVVRGQTVKERRYCLTDRGKDAWNATRLFYRNHVTAAEASLEERQEPHRSTT